MIPVQRPGSVSLGSSSGGISASRPSASGGIPPQNPTNITGSGRRPGIGHQTVPHGTRGIPRGPSAARIRQTQTVRIEQPPGPAPQPAGPSLAGDLSGDVFRRPLTSREMAAMSVLGALVLYERWQDCTMVRGESARDCAMEMGQGMAIGAVVATAGTAAAVALFGAPAVIAAAPTIAVAGLAYTAISYVP